MKFLSLSSLFLGSSVVWAAAEAPAEDAAGILVLDEKNFASTIKDNELVFVKFVAPWCGYCKKLTPEYNLLAEKLASDPKLPAVKLAAVDVTVNPGLGTEHEISGYPTLLLFRNGNMKGELYSEGRTMDAMLSWLTKVTGDAITKVIDETAAMEICRETPTTFIGSFPSDKAAEYKSFSAVAEASRQIGRFVVYFGSDSSKVSACRQDDGISGHIDVKPSTFAADFATFSGVERFPYFGPISGENYADYFATERTLVWFASDSSDYNSSKKVIAEVAKQFRDAKNFVWLDIENFKDHAQSFLGLKDFPSLVVHTKEGRYVFDKHSFTNAAEIKQFVQDVDAGKIEKNLMSDPVPETNDEAVHVVVGKTFETFVNTPNADKFLEVYAPWCGHCKKLDPIYTEFAEKHANSGLLVGKMDGTTNEATLEGYTWRGFPTIFFIKDKETTPIVYDGDRTFAGFEAFYETHGSMKKRDEL